MPLRMAAVALVLAGFPSLADGQSEQFPYTAYVTTDDVQVRSGPGENYYPTAKLGFGSAVEVYRHDPGGWYAIRPPEESFSWVAAQYLDPIDGRWAAVNAEGVVARVGSQLSDTRDVIQVRLDRGEEVEVLEAKRFGTGPAAQTWYKISPPSGEFRWVYGKFVARELPTTEPTTGGRRRNRIVDRLDPIEDTSSSEPTAEETGRDDEARDETDDDRAARRRRPARDDVDAEELDEDAERYQEIERDIVARRRGAPRLPEEDAPKQRRQTDEPLDGDVEATIDSERFQDELRRAPPADLPNVSRPGSRTSAHSLGDLLDQLELALSAMVAQEPASWNLTELRSDAQFAYDKASTAVERGRARMLLSKITRFEDLAQRYRSVVLAQSDAENLQNRLQDARATRAGRETGVASRFDGVGRLTPVVSRKVGSPTYALVDDRGVVQSYVTAAPGVNLRHYVGRKVGLTGTTGFESELNSRHVTARRVTVLDDDQPLRR